MIGVMASVDDLVYCIHRYMLYCYNNMGFLAKKRRDLF